MVEDRQPRQHQRRLRQDELDHLVADYLSGVKVKELAERYRITRQTVLEHMRRQGVPRRHPRLGPLEVKEACDLYRSGKSLADIEASSRSIRELSAGPGARLAAESASSERQLATDRPYRCSYVCQGAISFSLAASSNKTGMSHSMRASSY
jgi:hypothetical protein